MIPARVLSVQGASVERRKSCWEGAALGEVVVARATAVVQYYGFVGG